MNEAEPCALVLRFIRFYRIAIWRKYLSNLIVVSKFTQDIE